MKETVLPPGRLALHTNCMGMSAFLEFSPEFANIHSLFGSLPLVVLTGGISDEKFGPLGETLLFEFYFESPELIRVTVHCYP